MNENLEFGCNSYGAMNSDKFFNAPVNRIEKLVIMGGDEGRYHEAVFTQAK